MDCVDKALVLAMNYGEKSIIAALFVADGLSEGLCHYYTVAAGKVVRCGASCSSCDYDGKAGVSFSGPEAGLMAIMIQAVNQWSTTRSFNLS